MFERRDAGSDAESEPALIQIDSTVFETFSAGPIAVDSRMDRWLATWAGADR